ncbi:hypothetical protein NL362_27275, partial [Klebsiella pneumoniae]|nr:hypothetical protein [Klebsiella pneumoniae]
GPGPYAEYPICTDASRGEHVPELKRTLETFAFARNPCARDPCRTHQPGKLLFAIPLKPIGLLKRKQLP